MKKTGLEKKLELAKPVYLQTILSSHSILSSFKNKIMTRIEGENCGG
jgi:hypothetical protein